MELHLRVYSDALKKSPITRYQWRTQEFCSGGSTNSVEDREERETVSGDSSPLVRGSGASCNLVQEISFSIAKFS